MKHIMPENKSNVFGLFMVFSFMVRLLSVMNTASILTLLTKMNMQAQ